MTTLYLVRHGETVDNANQILQGQGQGKLNEIGLQQARALREQLRKNHVDVFVASDLQRSIDTCRIIAEPHGLPVEITSLLRERDWGDFTGMFIPDLKDKKWPENVETLEQMRSRARNFLTYLKTAYRDRVIVAVGHGIINKAIQSVYFNKPMNEIPRMTNAEVRVLIL